MTDFYFAFVTVIQLLLMHVFYLAILLMMIKLLCIHGQSFLKYSLPVLMDPQHFVKSGYIVYMYYGELIVTPWRL